MSDGVLLMKETEFAVGRYEDAIHAEGHDDILVGDQGYKYRILEGRVMPPYITPDRYFMSRNVKMREGDICFTGFPKSGSTWLSYILTLITTNGILPTEKTLRDSLQWIASSFTYPRTRKYLESLPSPRIFKSHMPYDMAVGGVPAGNPCRHIYIARNPKDVVVSYFHFERSKSWAGGYDGAWEHWLQMFMDGKVQRDDWVDHVLSWWKHRDAENILFLTYEDLKQNFDLTVRKIANFIHFPMTDSLLEIVADKSSFGNMSNDDFSNMHEIEELGSFFRAGQVGSWKSQFTSEQSAAFDKWLNSRLEGTELMFSYSGS